MALALPSTVRLVEVAPRDGLQNERTILSTDDKVQLIESLVAAGFRDIEVGSFVSPRWIPQLADTRAVLRRLPRQEGVRYWTLVPNLRGLQDALTEGASCVAFFMSVSESHNKSNVNRSVAESLAGLKEGIGLARREGLRIRAYLSTVFGCPYEGDVPVERVRVLSEALLEAGADELSLGDTIGVANPRQVQDVITTLERALPLSRLALHFHDTRGTALANVLAGAQVGISTFDSSLSGVGGCPYAPGASGNLATEDLLYLLQTMGVETGVDLEQASRAGLALRSLLGRALPGRYHNYFLAARGPVGVAGAA